MIMSQYFMLDRERIQNAKAELSRLEDKLSRFIPVHPLKLSELQYRRRVYE